MHYNKNDRLTRINSPRLRHYTLDDIDTLQDIVESWNARDRSILKLDRDWHCDDRDMLYRRRRIVIQ